MNKDQIIEAIFQALLRQPCMTGVMAKRAANDVYEAAGIDDLIVTIRDQHFMLSNQRESVAEGDRVEVAIRD